MPYPPTTPPTTRTNATPQVDVHASDHNVLAQAVKDILTELGTDPSGTFADLTARLAALTRLSIAENRSVTTDGNGTATVPLPTGGKLLGAAANGAQTAFPHFYLSIGTTGAASATFSVRQPANGSAVANSTVAMSYVAVYTL